MFNGIKSVNRGFGKIAVLLCTAVILFAACDSSEEPEASGSPDASTTPSASPSPTETGFAAQVRLTVEKERNESTDLFVFFVDEDLSTDGPSALTRCAEIYLDDYDSVSCFGFAGDEAYGSANVDDEQGTMENSCWVASLSVTREGDSRLQLENPDFDEANCPIG